jgi:hypothetical protein
MAGEPADSDSDDEPASAEEGASDSDDDTGPSL